MAGNLIEGRYRLRRKLQNGDPGRGVPDLWEADDGGDRYFVKSWKLTGGNAQALRALWNREVRGLMRLQGHPGASELFVRLQQLGVDDRQFYAILDGGRRELLSKVLETRSAYPWLVNLGEVGRRVPIWQGLLRIAEAIAVLHSEGTVHRNLSPSSVFVNPEGLGDFRLSGFEWSLRVSSTDNKMKPGGGGALKASEFDRDGGEYSTATDWFDFGVLATYVFGASVTRPKTRPKLREFVERPGLFNAAERALVLGLLEDDPERRLFDDREVLKAIRDAIHDLGTVTAAARRPVVLAARTGRQSSLGEAIERASNGEAPANDAHRQRMWMKKDLRGDFRVIARSVPRPHYILRGEKLSYRIAAWSNNGTPTWDIAYCEAVEHAPNAYQDDVHLSIGDRQFDVIGYPDASKNLRSLRDRSAPWNRVFAFRQVRSKMPPHLQDVHDFFRITHQLDTALTVAQICPVRVTATRRLADESEIEVTPIDEADRKDLAASLMLPPPPDQLRDWFDLGVETVQADDEPGPKRDTYTLLSRPVLGRDANTEIRWQFTSAVAGKDGPLYRFSTTSSSSAKRGETLYLARNFGGTIKQIRRRAKAIEELKEQDTLLRALDDPLNSTRVSDEQVPVPRITLKLDDSKIEALDRMWNTQPTFAIQGPPGTGKTTLIKAFSDRLLGSDPSAQVLITAHSHHTVDDVLEKLSEHFNKLPEEDRPIIVRLGADDGSEFAADTIARAGMETLAKSDLALRTRDDLRERLDAVRDVGRTSRDTDFRTMLMLVQDAANISLSTSNSGDLADLVDRGRRFDWSIIEEAGKAHGFDMVAALEESHRVVLIGDHEQLPPFNADLYKDLLADPLRVRTALGAAATFAPNLIDANIVADDETRSTFTDRCAFWRERVDFFGHLFNRSLEGEGRRAPAITLVDQHRMHPHIADVVGRTFYPDESDKGTSLNTPEETRERFKKDPPYSIVEDGWLPDERVVWVDVPWVQSTKHAFGETVGLFTSPVEAEAVLATLNQIRPVVGEDCDVQVLSPYNDQLDLINSRARSVIAGGHLQHLVGPPFNMLEGKRLGATVDEFQGSEADVVIVSLVRNNGYVPWRSVGFLKHANRMNVLMSRARHKLIIVGSWKFFDTRCDETTPEGAEYAYIGRLMKVLKEARKRGHAKLEDAPK
ncbi:MAG: AAA domain-containing protein [Pseudomonadota bacterium]